MKLSPLTIGIIVAGLLLFAIVAVVRSATSSPALPAVQNNVAAAISQPLPPPQPTVIQASWLAVQQLGAARYVWAGAWVPCQELTIDGAYVGIDTGIAQRWQQLGPNAKQDVVNICISEVYGK